MLDVLALAGIAEGSPLCTVLEPRAPVFELTARAHAAVVAPGEPGGLSHALRAGLAARMARLCGDEKTAALLQGAEPHEAADPAFDGGSDARATAILRHVDLLTVRPRDATRGDVQVLVAAGLDEADIVRLAELVSFMAYLLRLVAGLRALEEGR